MYRFQVKWIFTFLSWFLLLSPLHAQDDAMNVLFIAVDDLKPAMGCYGDTLAKTPHIDALAEKGIIFTHAYCQQAVCAPSRASLLTSRYPDQTRVEDLQTMLREVSPETVSLPEYLVSNGYETAATGKIFDFRSVDKQMDAPSWSVPYRAFYDEKYYDPENGKPSYYYASSFSKDTISKLIAYASDNGLDVNNFVKENYQPAVEWADVRYDGYADGAILNAGVELLHEVADEGKPFFLGVGFHRPHLPFVAPVKYWDLYKREDFTLPPFQQKAAGSPDIAYHNWGELRSYSDIPNSGGMTIEKQLELIHGYYAASSYIDDLVGMLLRELDELGLSNNTMIILWGDHGWHLGDHDLWCKHSNFEQATCVPLIISYPGQELIGVSSPALVEFTDVAPTICELGGVEIPQFFEGESLLPVMMNPDTVIRNAALSQYPKWNGIKGYSLRTERYRFTKWVYSDLSLHSQELYDYEIDPGETKSFHDDPGYAGVRNQLDSMVMERIRIPSTQTRISFLVSGISVDNDTSALPGTDVKFYAESTLADEEGEVTFTHLPGNYDYRVETRGYSPVTGSVEVTCDTLIHIFLLQEKYDAKIRIIQEWNGIVAEGMNVQMAGQTGTTDAKGEITFDSLVFDTYTIQVTDQEGASQDFHSIEIYSDTVLELYFTQPSYAIDLHLYNQLNETAVSGALVSFNGVEKTSDLNGNVLFHEVKGTYPLEISKDYYRTYTNELIVEGEYFLEIALDPSHSDLRIWIREGATPVPGAVVTIDSMVVQTENLGLAKFEKLENRKDYTYAVTSDTYQQHDGSFYLYADTTFEIHLTPLTTGRQIQETIDIYPSPVKDIMVIDVGSQKQVSDITVTDIAGRVVSHKSQPGQLPLEIEAGSLQSGTYMLLCRLEDFTLYVGKFIKL